MNVKQNSSDKNLELRSWVNRLIDTFREEYKTLNSETIEKIPSQYKFTKPCQIEIFLIENIDQHIFLITHESDRIDKEIIINGPYHDSTFPKEVERIMKEERWTRPAIINDRSDGKERQVNFATKFGYIIKRFKENIRGTLFLERKPCLVESQTFLKDGCCAIIRGSIKNLKIKSLIQRFHNDLNRIEYKDKKKCLAKNIEISSRSMNEALTKPIGYGVYFQPFKLIGDFPNDELNYKLVVEGRNIPEEKQYEFDFNDVKVSINTFGFIYIFCEDIDKVMRIMNTNFAISLFQGIDCRSIRIPELTLIYNMMQIAYAGTLRAINMYKVNRDFIMHDVISLDKLNDIINISKEIYKDRFVVDLLLHYLEAYTLFKYFESSHSFFFLWIFIEKYLFSLWQDFFSRDLKEEHSRLEHFSSVSDKFTVNNMMVILYNQGKISEELYKKLQGFKDKRNAYVHEGIAINPLDTQSLNELAFTIAKGLIQKKIMYDIF